MVCKNECRPMNVIIYLKHTQKRQTDCKSEPGLLKAFFKIPAGKYQTLLLLDGIHFLFKSDFK